MKKQFILANFFISLTLLSSCSYNFDKSQKESQLSDQFGNTINDKSSLVFANIKEKVIEPKCLKCHSNYSKYESVFESRSEIYEHSIVIKDMPKMGSPQLTDEEYLLLKEWLQIGAPRTEVADVDQKPPTPPVNSIAFERPVQWETVKIKIFEKRCTVCHNSVDAIAEPLETYSQVKGLAGRIFAQSVLNNYMPPPPNDDYSIPNTNALTAVEKDLFNAWVTDGFQGAPPEPEVVPEPEVIPEPEVTPEPEVVPEPLPTNIVINDPSVLNFLNLKEKVFKPKCLACHAGFAKYSNVFAEKDGINDYAVVTQMMPPTNSSSLTEDEKQLLKDWLSVGAPEKSLKSPEISNPQEEKLSKNPSKKPKKKKKLIS